MTDGDVFSLIATQSPHSRFAVDVVRSSILLKNTSRRREWIQSPFDSLNRGQNRVLNGYGSPAHQQPRFSPCRCLIVEWISSESEVDEINRFSRSQ
jgi:hypothetical protein